MPKKFIDTAGLTHIFSKIKTLVETSVSTKAEESHGHSNATTSAAGFMSAADKTKLDGLSAGGNADTATKLETARTINGVSFDGSADITIPAEFGITTAGDGAAYTADVPGITALTAGVGFIMIPHVANTSGTPTLNVNGLGAKAIRRRLSNSTVTTVAATNTGWLGAKKPVRMLFDGNFWIPDFVRPNAAEMYGTLPVANGGTGGTTAAVALANLGGVPVPASAAVGQFIRVSAVDENGKVTATEAVEMTNAAMYDGTVTVE